MKLKQIKNKKNPEKLNPQFRMKDIKSATSGLDKYF